MEIILGDSLVHYEMLNPDGVVPVVILHGWGHSGFLWHTIAQSLPSSCRVYLIDLPGFGRSVLGDSVQGVRDYASAVTEFIKKLNLTNVVLMGHSFGAQIAVLVSGQDVDISKLILIAPAIKRERWGIGALWYKLMSVLAKLKWLLPPSFTYHLSSGLNYTQASARMKVVFKNSIRVDVRKLLPAIQEETLVIWGERDREVLGVGKEIVSLIPHSRLKVIYDAGHNLHLEKPQELIRILERYIRE